MIHAIDVQPKMNARAATRLIMIHSLKELLLHEKATSVPKVPGRQRPQAFRKQTIYAVCQPWSRVTVDASAAALTLVRPPTEGMVGRDSTASKVSAFGDRSIKHRIPLAGTGWPA
jgi:hypothetical protein